MTSIPHKNQLSSCLFLMLTLVTSCGFFKSDHTESINWMSETSGIQLPNQKKDLEFLNTHEWGMIVKFETSEQAFEKFVQTYRLSPLNDSQFRMDLLNDIEEIPFDATFIQKPKDFLKFSDCKKGNSWTVLANKKTHTIWFEMLYPDFGGDAPPCDKDTVKTTVAY